ncbi:MAG: DDE-type integrase/transposase/recombinase [Nanoarchaeota archaeon]|nr:DDE-type integrase/transposase/recombinase [Nanoarchaeota archaeon]
MKKEIIRKEFFKLKLKGHSYSQCRKILFVKYGYETHTRTLQRWMNKLDNINNWDLKDESRKPKTIHRKITPEIENRIVLIKKQTGWGAEKIENLVDLSHTSINKILRKHKLTEPSKRKKKRIKYIRWQRKHPNSLWQIDHSDQKIEGKWVVSVIDDCSRKSLAFIPVNSVTTDIIVGIIDDLIKIYGKPSQILTDNGSQYGSKSKHSRFDRKCRKRGIEHIRGAVHSPTTTGKVERLFQTFKREYKFCNKDSELWRMRYNHFRPHMSLEEKTPDEIYNKFSLLF